MRLLLLEIDTATKRALGFIGNEVELAIAVAMLRQRETEFLRQNQEGDIDNIAVRYPLSVGEHSGNAECS